jgi:hypothetical protein
MVGNGIPLCLIWARTGKPPVQAGRKKEVVHPFSSDDLRWTQEESVIFYYTIFLCQNGWSTTNPEFIPPLTL